MHAALRGRYAGSTETVLSKDLETAEKSGIDGLLRSLQRWRSSGTGPVWMRIGGCIRYRFEDILAFEQSCRVPEATP